MFNNSLYIFILTRQYLDTVAHREFSFDGGSLADTSTNPDKTFCAEVEFKKRNF